MQAGIAKPEAVHSVQSVLEEQDLHFYGQAEHVVEFLYYPEGQVVELQRGVKKVLLEQVIHPELLQVPHVLSQAIQMP